MNHKQTIMVCLMTRIIVRNELLIVGGVGAAAGVCFFARRHGQLRELMDATNAAVKELTNKV
jgi:hypothetical protein